MTIQVRKYQEDGMQPYQQSVLTVANQMLVTTSRKTGQNARAVSLFVISSSWS